VIALQCHPDESNNRVIALNVIPTKRAISVIALQCHPDEASNASHAVILTKRATRSSAVILTKRATRADGRTSASGA
jgi:hypothetical protein